MRLLETLICAVIMSTGCVAVAQESNAEAVPPAKQEPARKEPCKPPKATFTPDPSPPASWERKGPKAATTVLQIVVDKKGKVHDLVVIHSGGNDADKQVIDSVRQWRFTPATCGTDPIETKINVEVRLSLR